MADLSTVDRSTSPPTVTVPRIYNAAHDLIERNLRTGRAGKIAYIDDQQSLTYGALAERVNQFANAIRALGVDRERRVLLCLQDSIDWPIAFLGCIKAGVVPVPVNTLLTTNDYEFMLQDSRADALVVSASLLPAFSPILKNQLHLKHVIVSGSGSADGHLAFSDLLAGSSTSFQTVDTLSDEACFWLYSSGSTGSPKGTVHIHSSPILTAELYARPILGIEENDVVYSAAKLFFAYGLGNSLSFPMSVGATTVLTAQRPTPQLVLDCLIKHRATVFCAVPTLYASLLAQKNLPRREDVSIRICASAGEALPRDIGERWRQHFGTDILDGIGSTEMLHIFLSNRRDMVRYGTTGVPVPGYEVRLVDENGSPVPQGELGELQICGPTAATSYWNNRDKTLQTFHGPWIRSGDKYSIDEDGFYVYGGRSDDMIKVSGIYVSPVEVESALIEHPAVLEAAVVGRPDEQGLIKPLACVVLGPGYSPAPELVDELKRHVKSRLAPYKYPRWIEFLPDLPKTATGKIQRFKLRT